MNADLLGGEGTRGEIKIPRGVPLALWDSTTSTTSGNVAASGTAGITPFDLGALTSPFRTAFVIDQITFLAWSAGQSGNEFTAANFPNDFGRTLRARFTIGHRAISHDWIPLWNYGPRLQTSYAGQLSPSVIPFSTIETTAGLLGAQVASSYGWFSTFVWRLPRPLIVPPGMSLVPSILRGGDGSLGTVTVEIGYIGRRMPDTFKVPKEIDIPFVAQFLPPEVSGTTFLQSRDRVDMTNTLDVPVDVQRIICRTAIGGVQANVATINDLFSTENDTSKLNLYLSAGRRIIDNAPLFSAFDRNRGSLNTSFVLPPNECVTFQIPNAATPAYSVSLVGSRRQSV